MAGLFAGVAMAQDLPEAGVWAYNKDIDEFTDEVSHHLFLVAEEISASDGNIVMHITCVDNETDFTIHAGKHTLNKTYDNDDSWDVDYRIDDLKGNKFKVFSNYSAFRPYGNGLDIPLIKSFFNHDKLRIRFPTYNGRKTATFKITNIETEIKPIREACGW